ncbi:tlde1 domain-containing protein [Labrys wisconsinensis]|uniref:Tlde1 domain-containing protein n=1 Tax=Labrys wisconsinensis TaxID=425677 RepID=A0ABU0JGK3_9HYPH|nr:tlde1 domain-containing protein [Labrys wisconsinensis]MDQ0473418.1 hypothetical protein [Labrys wisconsinensis]
MRNPSFEFEGSAPRLRRRRAGFPFKTIALSAFGLTVLVGVAQQGERQMRILSNPDPVLPGAVSLRGPAPAWAPPLAIRPAVAASETRPELLLDGRASFQSAAVDLVRPGRYDALIDPAFGGGAAPRALAESAPLYADLRPSAPAPTVVAALAPPADQLRLTQDADAAPAEPVSPVLASLEPPDDDAVPLPVPRGEVVMDVPLPLPRPADAPAPPVLRQRPQIAAPAAPQPIAPQVRHRTRIANLKEPVAPAADNRSFFERFFGSPRPAGPALAYASTEDATPPTRGGSLFGPSLSRSAIASPGTAVYDISARTVYLPNGERLEAHSGLGSLRDDPGSVHVKMRGATPPHTYDLTEREALFHGVRALRLTPVGGTGAVHGRVGLLAHTYMLGPRGDSNGCVSFRDYNKFLQAYLRGEIKRLVVVSGG